MSSLARQVYLIDITELPDTKKWYDFFGKRYNSFIKNGTAFNIFYDEFGYEGKFDTEWHEQNPEVLGLEREFIELLTEAGVPRDAEVWMQYWW